MGKLLRLTNIAVLQCIRHANSITDLGDLPYHLVKPILCKMSARQLDIVETSSNNITPFSDELWIGLIKKDFPTRPFTIPNKMARKPSTNKMVYKAMYRKYEEEQEQFRKNSTERLKHLTNMIKQKKSENSVIEVDEVLSDPTVRVQRSFGSGNRNSIVNRARRELSNRSLMFPRRDRPMIKLRKPAPAGSGKALHGVSISRTDPSHIIQKSPNQKSSSQKSSSQKSSNPQSPRKNLSPRKLLSPQKRTSKLSNPKLNPQTLPPTHPPSTNKESTKPSLEQNEIAAKKRKNESEPERDIKSIKSSVFN